MTKCCSIGNLIAPGLYPSEMTAKTVSTLDKFTPPKGHEDDFSGCACNANRAESSGANRQRARLRRNGLIHGLVELVRI